MKYFVTILIAICLRTFSTIAQTTFERTYGGTDQDYGRSVQQTSDSGYIIARYTYINLLETDVYLVKTNSSGDTLWTRTYGTSDGVGYSILQTSEGGYIIAGYVVLIKTNSSGDTLWTRTYGGTGYSVQQTSDGGYIIAGDRLGDVYLVKTQTDGLVSVQDDRNVIPAGFALQQNYPNPFNPATVIRYSLPVTSYTTLKVYNMLGQEVATLVNEELKPGSYEVTWDAAGFASGVYFYRLTARAFVETKKLLLLR